jgi:hypothetical protein
MRRPLTLLAIVIVASVSAVAVAAQGDSDPRAVLGVPAYGYPHRGSMWDGLAELGNTSVVILNPANGPGHEVDPAYEKALKPVRDNEVTIYGYVDTAYGKRSVADVLADAERFVRLYHPVGIFLDQTPADSDSVEYLGEISTALRKDGLQIAFNPGQPDIDRRLVDLADHIINFEGSVSDYEKAKFPSWVDKAPFGRWWHLVYAVKGEAEMKSVLSRAAGDHAGVVFVTDGEMPNPWDHLPAYWDEEVRRVGGN